MPNLIMPKDILFFYLVSAQSFKFFFNKDITKVIKLMNAKKF